MEASLRSSSDSRRSKVYVWGSELDEREKECERRQLRLLELDEQLTILDRELRAKEEEMKIRQLLMQYSSSGHDVYEIIAKQQQSDARVKKLTSDMYRVQEKLANIQQQLMVKERTILNLNNTIQKLEVSNAADLTNANEITVNNNNTGNDINNNSSNSSNNNNHHEVTIVNRRHSDSSRGDVSAAVPPEIKAKLRDGTPQTASRTLPTQAQSPPNQSNTQQKRINRHRQRGGSLTIESRTAKNKLLADIEQRRKSIAGIPEYDEEDEYDDLNNPVSKACLIQ